MATRAAYIFAEEELQYHFNADHPFKQKRLMLTRDLLQALGSLPGERIVRPRAAKPDELLAIHTARYIEVVKALSAENPRPDWVDWAGKYGLDTEDTPFFPRMHQAASLIAGGSITAADLVMSGQAVHALHLGGGLHHAMPNRGSGFCVYNDAAIAIAYLRRNYGARVLYIDTDVHHGDGVQACFYSEPDVCTFSIHETGNYLFPGTGAATERGEGLGFGACYNMPVEPFTEDESWLENFQACAEKITEVFKPDVIVSQHGCDAHYFDPLSHIHCSMRIYLEMPRLIHALAHRFCNGRWIALGGGGYDIWRVVPRAWSLVWLVMAGHPLPEKLAEHPFTPLPQEWLKKWQPESPVPLPRTWLDDKKAWEIIPRQQEITAKNRRTKEIALNHIT
ncbi:MAG TPA: acetoin utilization protein AcuC [Bacilli bacterium]